MEPILDETSLVPCPVLLPAVRIEALAETLRELDATGAPRVLRTTRDAADRDIHQGKGLRAWCFDKGTNRDAGRLVAFRLDKQPYVDGDAGLFGQAEGERVVVAASGGVEAQGLGLAALTGAFVIALACHSSPEVARPDVTLSYLEENQQERSELVVVIRLTRAAGVSAERRTLHDLLDGAVSNGPTLVARAADIFPHLVLGLGAREQLTGLNGTEPYFKQVVRHLRALELGAAQWAPETAFKPVAVTFSVEAPSTLGHGTYGPMRNFSVPAGYETGQFSLHTKMTGGPGARLYYRCSRRDDEKKTPYVLIGYVGPHLPTVKFPT